VSPACSAHMAAERRRDEGGWGVGREQVGAFLRREITACPKPFGNPAPDNQPRYYLHPFRIPYYFCGGAYLNAIPTDTPGFFTRFLHSAYRADGAQAGCTGHATKGACASVVRTRHDAARFRSGARVATSTVPDDDAPSAKARRGRRVSTLIS
jgi:hypothetical protein